VRESENVERVEALFAALDLAKLDEARATWHEAAVWHVLDRNEFHGDYTVDAYFTDMLPRFFAKYGDAYTLEMRSVVAHGELVVVFVETSQPTLGANRGLMIFRLRDEVIVEGWTMSRGSDSILPF
jgi:hypothetical protein